jgi:hypothetical protein
MAVVDAVIGLFSRVVFEGGRFVGCHQARAHRQSDESEAPRWCCCGWFMWIPLACGCAVRESIPPSLTETVTKNAKS